MFRLSAVVVILLVSIGAQAQEKPCKADKEKKVVCPTAMKGALTTPLLPGALPAVEEGMDPWSALDNPLVVCLAERRSWVGNEKVKMIIGPRWDRLSAMVDVFAKERSSAHSLGKLPEVYLAVSPLTTYETVSGALRAITPYAVKPGLYLVGAGNQRSLGVLPVALTAGNSSHKAPDAGQTFFVTVSKDTIGLEWNSKKTVLKDKPEKTGPPVDRERLAKAVTRLQQETKVYFVAQIRLQSGKDVAWDRLFQTISTIRSTASKSTRGKAASIALTLLANPED